MPKESEKQPEITWIQLANIKGEPRNYKVDLQTTRDTDTKATQTRVSKWAVIHSPELNSYRVIPFDPETHEPNFPTVTLKFATENIPNELSTRTTKTAEHDKRTHPYYIEHSDSLSELTKTYLRLSQLYPQSLVSRIYADEIQATLHGLAQELEQTIKPANSSIDQDGIPF